MPTPLSPTRREVIGHQDVRLNVWDYGGDGPNLILCHCTGTCARVWDPIVEGLQDSFRVLAPDSRGHGDSEKPEDPDAYVWSHSGTDLCALVEQLGLGDTVYAAGHSAGAAHVAYAQLQQPGIFKKLILIDGIIAPPTVPLSVDTLADSARRRRATFDSSTEALERFAAKPPMASWHPDCLSAYVAHGLSEAEDGSLSLKCPPEIEGVVYEHGGAPDVFERLGELDSDDVSLVTGSKSMVKLLVEFQHQFMPSAHYHELEGISHFIPQEAPADIAQILTQCL